MQKKIVMILAAGLIFAGCANEPSAPVAQGDNIPKTKVDDHAQALFQANCATCHNPVKDATGPALHGALALWDNDAVRLKAFIHNPAKSIADKDKRAVAVFNKYGPTVMTGFPLTDADLDALIDAYMR